MEQHMRLKDKVAIVTGAATGIGQAIAVRFAQEGAAVVIDYVGGADVPAETAQKIASIAADVSQPGEVQALIEGAVKAFGRLDIAVNNAGIEKKFAFVDYPLEEVR